MACTPQYDIVQYNVIINCGFKRQYKSTPLHININGNVFVLLSAGIVSVSYIQELLGVHGECHIGRSFGQDDIPQIMLSKNFPC